MPFYCLHWCRMFVSMQIYEFLSKSQLRMEFFRAFLDVCLYANIRIFKQITTALLNHAAYEGCLSLCKYTNF